MWYLRRARRFEGRFRSIFAALDCWRRHLNNLCSVGLLTSASRRTEPRPDQRVRFPLGGGTVCNRASGALPAGWTCAACGVASGASRRKRRESSQTTRRRRRRDASGHRDASGRRDASGHRDASPRRVSTARRVSRAGRRRARPAAACADDLKRAHGRVFLRERREARLYDQELLPPNCGAQPVARAVRRHVRRARSTRRALACKTAGCSLAATSVGSPLPRSPETRPAKAQALLLCEGSLGAGEAQALLSRKCSSSCARVSARRAFDGVSRGDRTQDGRAASARRPRSESGAHGMRDDVRDWPV